MVSRMFLNKGFWSLWEPRTQTYKYSGTSLCNITKGHDNNDNVNNKNMNKEHQKIIVTIMII